jgi:DNA repair protein RadC
LPQNKHPTGRGTAPVTITAMTFTITLADAPIAAYPTDTHATTPESLFPLLDPFRDRAQEHVIVITLDTHATVIGVHTVTIGTANASLIHPREVFRPAILDNAAGILLAHNHPSGEATPSDSDIEATTRMYTAGAVLGIELVDHLIIGKEAIRSLRGTHGYLFR